VKKRASQHAVDGRLDLHGLTLVEAHRLTREFLHEAIDQGARAVLIITGKGQGGSGAIRRELPHWLEVPSLRPFVASVTLADPRQGGEGAYRISLRSGKKAANA
jgi:DNA-nicking Smr family endonuclease